MLLDQMKRREFITLLGGAAGWPLAARAQRPERMRRIGYLSSLDENDPEAKLAYAAFARLDNPAINPRPCRRGDRMIGWREFITLLGGTAGWPLGARAQQPMCQSSD